MKTRRLAATTTMVCFTFGSIQAAWAGNEFYSETKQGTVCLDKGSLNEAEQHFKTARMASESDHSDRWDHYAKSLLNLGKVYTAKRNFRAAEKNYTEALGIWKKSFGDEALETSAAYHGLGDTFRKEEEYEKAAKNYEKAMKAREMAAADHTDLADTCSGLAECYGRLGRKTDAIPLMKRAVSIREKALGASDPRVAKSYFVLASLYEDTGKTAMAIPVYEKVVSVCEAAYGTESPKVATTLEHLGAVYAKENKWHQSELMYKRALTLRDKQPDDKTKDCIREYVRVLKHNKKDAEAAKLEAKLTTTASANGAASASPKGKPGGTKTK